MTCPSCGAETSGRFCSSCGSPVDGALCAGCGSQLTPGAKFCHRCGTAAGAAPVRGESPRGAGSALPWAVAGIALLALVAMIAGRNFAVRGGSALDGSANALPVPGLDDVAAGGAPPPGMRAPDISNMSPQERADRLFDRVMRLAGEGKVDSIGIFAPMAIQAYQMIGTLDADQRYDMGRLAETMGDGVLAAAQADTILAQQPNHLLGLILAMRAAGLNEDEAARRRYEQRFVAAEPQESKRNLPEYQRHRAEIADAIAKAKRS